MALQLERRRTEVHLGAPVEQISGRCLPSPRLINVPTTNAGKSVSALPPQMDAMLAGSVFSSITRPLLSHGLVIGKHPQDMLVSPLGHTSRLDRHGTVHAPFEPSA